MSKTKAGFGRLPKVGETLEYSEDLGNLYTRVSSGKVIKVNPAMGPALIELRNEARIWVYFSKDALRTWDPKDNRTKHLHWFSSGKPSDSIRSNY